MLSIHGFLTIQQQNKQKRYLKNVNFIGSNQYAARENKIIQDILYIQAIEHRGINQFELGKQKLEKIQSATSSGNFKFYKTIAFLDTNIVGTGTIWNGQLVAMFSKANAIPAIPSAFRASLHSDVWHAKSLLNGDVKYVTEVLIQHTSTMTHEKAQSQTNQPVYILTRHFDFVKTDTSNSLSQSSVVRTDLPPTQVRCP